MLTLPPMRFSWLSRGARTTATSSGTRAPASVDMRSATSHPAGAVPAGDLWLRYGVRGLATATVVLLASVWFAFGGSVRERDRESTPLRPGIENAVAEVFWLL